jgi:SAM-dependent methyltransferase
MLANILQGLPFPDGQFDYVHQRLLVAGIPTVQWPEVIRELIRVTRPGGWVELLEVGITIKNAGPATTRLLTWMAEQSRERGVDPSMVSRLGDLLVQAGLHAVETHHIPAPLGAWAGHVGLMLKTDVLRAFDAVKGIYCAQTRMHPEQFDSWVQEATQEWEQRQASYLFHAFYGKRALNS